MLITCQWGSHVHYNLICFQVSNTLIGMREYQVEKYDGIVIFPLDPMKKKPGRS